MNATEDRAELARRKIAHAFYFGTDVEAAAASDDLLKEYTAECVGV